MAKSYYIKSSFRPSLFMLHMAHFDILRKGLWQASELAVSQTLKRLVKS